MLNPDSDKSEQPDNKVNMVWDTTLMDMFQVCPQKYNLRFNKRRESVDKPEPLDKGYLIHVGHEAYFKVLQQSSNWEGAVQASLEAVKKEEVTSSQLSASEVTRILEVLEETHTVHRFKDIGYEILAVEQPFMYILHEDENVRMIMIGKIDLLVNDYPHYTNLPIDHKSYSRGAPAIRFTNQFMNYSLAMNSPFLLVNKVGMAETIGNGNKRTAAPEARHKRVVLSYDPLIWNQWKRDTIRWFNRYYDCCREDQWERDTTSCNKFNRLCEFFEVCDTSGDDNKIYKLETNFKAAEKWDVSHALTRKGWDK
jgi:hypothetical protein